MKRGVLGIIIVLTALIAVSTSVEAIAACGSVAASDTLTANVSGTGTCITITGDNLVFNCLGNTITFDTSGGSYSSGILMANRRNVTIQNCVIRDTNGASQGSVGINATNVNNSQILNNNIQTNGTNQSHGIVFFGNNTDITIRNNTIDVYGTSSFSNGVYFIAFNPNPGRADNSLVENNNITVRNGAIYYRGQFGNNHTFANNTGYTEGTTSVNGFYIVITSNITISGNNLTFNGSESYAINFDRNNDTAFYNNRIYSFYSTSRIRDYNAVIIGSGYNRNYTNNLFYTNGTNTITAWVSIGINNTIFNNNTLYCGSQFCFGTEGTSVNNFTVSNNKFSVENASGYGLSTTIISMTQATASFSNNLFVQANNNSAQRNWISVNDNYNISSTNTTFKSPYGSINYPSFTINTSVSATNLNITQNRVRVISSSVKFLNTSAQITLVNASPIAPGRLLVDYADSGSYIPCASANCTNAVSYNNGTVQFNVSRFTSYAANDTYPVSVNESSNLTSNITVNGTAINIMASNIVFDCLGNTIFFDNLGSGEAYGINVSGYNNVTIRNCRIFDNTAAGDNNRGISIVTSVGSNISNVTVFTSTGTSGTAYSIYLSAAHNGSVSNSVAGMNSTSATPNGFTIQAINSRNNTISGNTLYLNVSSIAANSFVASFITTASDNVLENNSVHSNVSVTHYAVSLQSQNTTVRYNNITVFQRDTATTAGISIAQHNQTIYGNTITVNTSSTPTMYGIDVGTSNDSTIYNNVINIRGDTGTTTGINLGSNSRQTSVSGNNISSVCPSSTVCSAVDVGNSVNTTVSGNILNATSGTTFVIDVNAANYAIINNNTIFGNATAASSHGIRYLIGSDTQGVRIINNNVTMISSDALPYGIRLSAANLNNDCYLANNSVNVTGSLSTARGISTDNIQNVTIYNSTIYAYGTSTVYGIYTDSTNSNITINLAYIENNATDSASYALVDNDNATWSNITIFKRANTARWLTRASTATSNLSAITFANSNGSIKLNNFLANYTITNDILNITYNLSRVNSSTSSLNTTGQITLHNISTAAMAVDYNDNGTFADCSSPQCVLQSFNGSTIVFNVSSFTGYSAMNLSGGGAACPGTISIDTTLTGNVTSTGNCVTFNANNIVLDCNGYTMTWDTGGTGSDAVSAGSKTGITIKNCNMADGNSGGANGYGIVFSNITNSFITNNTIQTNGTDNNYGVYSTASNYNLIANNTIRSNGSGNENTGIYLDTSNHSLIFNNTILPYGAGSNPHGIEFSNANDNNITQNNITKLINVGNAIRFGNTCQRNRIVGNFIDMTPDGQNTIELNNNYQNTTISDNYLANGGFRGVLSNANGENLNVTNNTIFLRQSTVIVGILINSAGSIANNNNIYANTSNNAYGVRSTGVSSGSIQNNYISFNTTASGYGISLEDTTNSVISGNNVSINSTTTDNRGIRTQGTTTGNNITNNILNVNGSNTNYGIIFTANTDYNLVENNLIRVQTGSQNEGIHSNTGSSNTFRNNNISVFGSLNNRGIRFFNNANNNTASNSIINVNGTTSYGVFVDGTANSFNNNTLNDTTEWLQTSTGAQGNFTNTTFQTQNGSIFISGLVQLNDTKLVTRAVLNISVNSAYVNSTNMSTLNQSAQVTLRNVPASNPQPIVDFEDDGTFADCNATQCTVINSSNLTFIMNVSSFTNYSTEDSISCGSTLTSTTTLTENLTCPGTAFLIGANNVELNCNGYTVSYGNNGSDSQVGVNVTGFSGVAIRNCILVDGNASGSDGYGIRFTTVNNSIITNNTITTNGTTNNYGIRINGSVTNVNNSVTNNRVNARGTTTGNRGIYIDRSYILNISQNNVSTNGTTSNDGINLNIVTNATVNDNNVSANGTSSLTGLYIYSTVNVSFYRNNVSTIGTGASFIGTTDLVIENNSINGSEAGIYFETSSRTNLSRNNITSSSGYGISYAGLGGTGNNLADSNVINTSSGILYTATQPDSNFTNNNVTVTNGHGININSNSPTIYLNNNILTMTPPSGGPYYGIDVGATNNSIINNLNLTILGNTAWMRTTLAGRTTNFTNTTLRNNNGSVFYLGTFQLENQSAVELTSLNISANRVRLNSSTVPFLNRSAQIILNNVNTSIPIVDFQDDGTYQICNATQCQLQSFNGSTIIFNVSSFTSYSTSNSGVNITLTKTDDPNPVSNGSILNYTITFNVTDGTAFNVTINETYPGNVTFINSTPNATSGNNSWSVGNLTGSEIYQINISVLVNSNLSGGTVLTNTVNVTYANSSGSQFLINVTENTTVSVPLSPPILENVTLAATSIQNLTSDNLTVAFNLTSPSNMNPAWNITDWRVNQSSIVFFQYPFETNVSGITTSLRDYSTSNISATLGFGSSSATPNWTTSGQVGAAYNFDGTDDQINISDTTDPTEFSLEVWVKPDVVSSKNIFLRTDASGPGTSWSHQLRITAGSAFEAYVFDGALKTVTGNSTVAAGSWYHVVMIAEDGGNLALYVNGSQEGTNASVSTLWTGGNQYRVGSNSGGGFGFFDGIIDEVRLYNRTLTPSEISLLYSEGLAGRQPTTLHSSETEVGETWSVAVTPNNHDYEGNTTLTNNLTIRTTQAPIISNLTLNATTIQNTTNDNLTAYFTVTDADGDSTTNITNWLVNGTSVMVLNLAFEGGSNASSSRDYSNFSNNITGNAGDPEFLPSGNALGFGAYEFDGVDDLLTAPHNDSLNLVNGVPMSWESFVFYNSSCSDAYPVIVAKSNTGSTSNYHFEIVKASGLFSLTWYNGGYATHSSTVAIPSGYWTHLAAVYNGSHILNYRNGTFDNAVAQGSAPVTNTELLRVGNRAGDNDFCGKIDYVRIWNRSLSGSQIAALYNYQTNLIVSNETSAGDTWQACVTPNDKTQNGNTSCSNVLTINSDAANATVVSLTKTDSPDPLNLSNTTILTYQINFTVTNGTAYNVTINETYPSNVTFVNSTPSATSGNNSWNAGNITATNTYQINITVNVSNSLANGTILTNTVNATLANSTGSSFLINVTENTTVLNTVNVQTNATLTKTDSPDPLNISNTTLLTYQINFTVTQGTAYNVTINETYSGNVAFVNATPSPTSGNSSWNAGNVSTSYQINITVNVSNSLANGTILTNIVNATYANVTGSSFILNATQNTTILADVVNQSVVQITKTDSPDPLNISNTTILTYQINITTTNGTGYNITLTDVYPAQVSFVNSTPSPNAGNDSWIVGNLTLGQTFQVNITVNVSSSLSNGTVINNTANISYANATGSIFSANATQNTTILVDSVPSINISMTKTDAPDPVVAGQNLVYTVNVNVTNGTAYNVTLSDTYPAQVSFVSSSPSANASNNTWIVGNLTAGQSFQVNITVNVHSGTANGTLINNTANISYANSTGSILSLNATSQTTVSTQSFPIVINNNTNITTNGTTTGPGIIINASNVTVDCQNNIITGSGIDVGVNLTGFNNVTIQNCVFVNFAVGAHVENSNLSKFFNDTARSVVDGVKFIGSAQNGAFNNTIIAASDEWVYTSAGSSGNAFENTSYNDTGGQIVIIPSVTYPANTNASQSLLDVSSPYAFLNSTALSFLDVASKVTITGLSNVTQALILGDFDDNDVFQICSSPSCSLISFASGTAVFNTSGWTSYTTVDSGVNFTISKTSSPNPVTAGSNVVYTITATVNSGFAQNITVVESSPAELTFVSSNPANVSANTWNLSNLSAGQSAQINITYNVNSSFSGTLQNNVTVTFQNSTNGTISTNVSDNTTVQPASPGGGGQGGGGGGGSGASICPPFCQYPENKDLPVCRNNCPTAQVPAPQDFGTMFPPVSEKVPVEESPEEVTALEEKVEEPAKLPEEKTPVNKKPFPWWYILIALIAVTFMIWETHHIVNKVHKPSKVDVKLDNIDKEISKLRKKLKK